MWPRKASVETKYNSPKISGITKNNQNPRTPKQISSSNLPTANNSFYTISSPEHEKMNIYTLDEYAGLCANQNYSLNQPQGRKGSAPTFRKGSDSVESVDGHGEAISPNTSIHVNSNKKKSEDFKTKFKTEMCKFWVIDGRCKFGDNVN